MPPAAVCVFCGDPLNGPGNNPAPVVTAGTGKACDRCNATIVLPARVMAMNGASVAELGDEAAEAPAAGGGGARLTVGELLHMSQAHEHAEHEAAEAAEAAAAEAADARTLVRWLQARVDADDDGSLPPLRITSVALHRGTHMLSGTFDEADAGRTVPKVFVDARYDVVERTRRAPTAYAMERLAHRLEMALVSDEYGDAPAPALLEIEFAPAGMRDPAATIVQAPNDTHLQEAYAPPPADAYVLSVAFIEELLARIGAVRLEPAADAGAAGGGGGYTLGDAAMQIVVARVHVRTVIVSTAAFPRAIGYTIVYDAVDDYFTFLTPARLGQLALALQRAIACTDAFTAHAARVVFTAHVPAALARFLPLGAAHTAPAPLSLFVAVRDAVDATPAAARAAAGVHVVRPADVDLQFRPDGTAVVYVPCAAAAAGGQQHGCAVASLAGAIGAHSHAELWADLCEAYGDTAARADTPRFDADALHTLHIVAR
jgi:hypothetical protein